MSVLAHVLSWTGLSQVLCVVGAGLFAVVTAWTVRLLVRHAWYTHRLSSFSKPQTHSWLIGHLGQVGHTQKDLVRLSSLNIIIIIIIIPPQIQSTEEGLLQMDDLVQTYKHSCCWFLGPFYHMVRLFHPDYVKPLLMAPGRLRHQIILTPHFLKLTLLLSASFQPASQ